MSPAFLTLHGTLILEPGAFDSGQVALHEISKTTLGVAVFHGHRSSPVFYTSQVISQRQTRVKLNRVFFPR